MCDGLAVSVGEKPDAVQIASSRRFSCGQLGPSICDGRESSRASWGLSSRPPDDRCPIVRSAWALQRGSALLYAQEVEYKSVLHSGFAKTAKSPRSSAMPSLHIGMQQ